MFAISKKVLTEFLKECDIFSNDFSVSDLGVLWNLCNAPQSKGEIYNAGNGLCRYEFAEFLVRLAVDVFYKNKQCATIKEFFDTLLTEYVIPGMNAYDLSSWRTEFYLVEDVDYTLKAYKPILEGVYVKYSTFGPGPTDKMNLHEFRLMCNEAGFINESFPVREVDMCFRQALMTEVDEIFKGDHLELLYVEFIEAITRVANLIFSKLPEEVTLDKKLENSILMLIKLCPPAISKGFTQPTEETFFNMKHSKKEVLLQEYLPAI